MVSVVFHKGLFIFINASGRDPCLRRGGPPLHYVPLLLNIQVTTVGMLKLGFYAFSYQILIRWLTYMKPFELIMFFHFHSILFSGPAAFCQRSQCSIPFTLSTQHAEQSGARSAALEKAGPGTEEVCVRPPCCSQLNCPARKSYGWSKKEGKIHCDGALNLYRFLFLICGLYLIKCDTSEVNMVKKSVEQKSLADI